jgi:hypothetical protein
VATPHHDTPGQRLTLGAGAGGAGARLARPRRARSPATGDWNVTPAANVPNMAHDLGSMAAAVTEFADGHSMTIVPAIPGSGSGRTVCLDPGVLDLHGFLELARKLGDGALYLRTENFGLDPGTGQLEDVPARLARRKGQACELSVAFAAAGHGLLHFWEQTEPWYQEFLDSQDAEMLHDADEERRTSGEDRDRLATELAEAILADREFRASSQGIRRRRAQMLVPDGTDRQVGWDAAERARERAEELSDESYRPIKGQLDDIAAEFLASPGWQQAASAGARKKAADPADLRRGGAGHEGRGRCRRRPRRRLRSPRGRGHPEVRRLLGRAHPICTLGARGQKMSELVEQHSR